MENTDLVRNSPRLEPLRRLQEVFPQEKRRQAAEADSLEEAQGQVPVDAPLDRDRLAEAVERANAAVKALDVGDRQMRFSVDESTQELVLRIVDRHTDEVIRQIPQEVVLRNLRNIADIRGLLFDQAL